MILDPLKSKFFTTVLTFLTLIIFSCKHRSEDSSLQADQNDSISRGNPHIVMIVSQGFYSCTYKYEGLESRLRVKVLEAMPEKARPVKVTIINACFNGGLLDSSWNESLFYKIIESDGSVATKKAIGPEGFVALVNGVTKRLSAQGDSPRIILVGHSHGAWLVMKTLAEGQLENFLLGIYTIDPISYAKCNQAEILSKIFGPKLGVLNTVSAECQRAPSDLSSKYPVLSAMARESWINFYQTEFVPLHSSSIEGATNIQIESEPYNPKDIQHRDILFNGKVWNIIERSIENQIHKAFG